MDYRRTLYRPEFEHDACGVGFVADIGGHASHRILELAIESVVNVVHRGAVSADAKTGDGAGVLTQLPGRLLRREAERLGVRVEDARDLGLAMAFLPREQAARGRAQVLCEGLARSRGLQVVGWREVPVDAEALGAKAAATQPSIQQLLLLRPSALSREAYERELFLLRKAVERRALEEGLKELYIPSLSSRTVVYKGLLVATQLSHFYRDLSDPDFETALAVFHQRYSTNTFPTWVLAQPFHFLAHNGEINTLMGNRNWMRAREAELRSDLWGERAEELKRVVMAGGSDSMSLDNALELLVMSGRDILEAFMLLVPEAWENMPLMPKDLRAFYEFGACLSEPWDGPAALAFTDGRYVGGALDRNGLRPARYKVTEDGLMVLGSEVGVVEIDDARVVEKGRLGPGQMVAVDTERGVLLRNEDIKREVARRRPYGEWLDRSLRQVPALPPSASSGQSQEAPPLNLQQVFGYTVEDFPFILKPMLETGKEPVGSMGDDTPLSVLSKKSRLVYTYVKQLFAQVTNPPIDPLREQLVMSLCTYLGARGSILESTPEHAKLIRLESPFLLDEELEALRRLDDPAFRSRTLPCLFEVAAGPEGLRAGLEELCRRASEAVDEGVSILILSDRGTDAVRAPIPMLLAVGAVQHHLIREGKRMRVSLIAETGEAREVHHFGALVGFGASAVNPYLAISLVRHLAAHDRSVQDKDPAAAVARYRKSVEAGLLKIISKMGISTITSYHGAQIFEVIGLGEEVVERCFAGTASRVRGAGFRELAEEVLARHARAYALLDGKLDIGGHYRYRRREGEYHAFNPDVVKAIHRVAKTGRYEDHKHYAALVNNREPLTIRDLLRHKEGKPIPLEEVEPIEAITRRFITAGMSLGALSAEAHENLAIAMNRLGGKSDTGEGGEDPRRYRGRRPRFDRNSRIKQVASGRFGVTPEYLVNAEELEIKMAQGSKPGEGGQLPGHKVSPYIAKLRLAVPGLPLISPPPHHDIYSIEDLAQLIYDLKQVNPRAKVCVKLVAEA
ncbi:MAG: glutamate synthase large subunit, partial [Nitrospinota bacterium]